MMKKARSVDFSAIRKRGLGLGTPSIHAADFAASNFSRQAARADDMDYNTMPQKNSSSSLLSCSCKDTTCGRHCTAIDSSISNAPVTKDGKSFVLQLSERTFAFGRISCLVIGLAALANFSYSQLNATGATPFGGARPISRMSLGSAAISSVTEALSPILPFAGGLDLRREDYWINSGNWVETIQLVVSQVKDAFKTPASSTQLDVSSDAATVAVPSKRQDVSVNRILTISAQNPFLSVEKIEALTLADISELFLFVRSGRPGYGGFSNSSRVNKVLEGMDKAISASRGAGVKDANPGLDDSVDSLKFLAAMRIFAEWRVLRQVPEGYRGFAVGMSLGHKDIVQNVGKIEQAIHCWLDHQKDTMALQTDAEYTRVAPELRTPTIRALLEHEIKMDIHPTSRLPVLKEKTAAMGLLWVRRQLHYQTRLFDNVLHVPQKFSSTPDAVNAAYQQVYDRYHGWAVQKLFTYSFQAAPDAEQIFRHMNPRRLEEVRLSWKEEVKSTSKVAPSMNRDQRNEDTNPLQSFWGGVVENWEKLGCFITQCGNLRAASPSSKQEVEGADNMEEFITHEMIKDAHNHISKYLKVVNPLLEDLASLFSELNMDDPTKV